MCESSRVSLGMRMRQPGRGHGAAEEGHDVPPCFRYEGADGHGGARWHPRSDIRLPAPHASRVKGLPSASAVKF